MKHHRYFRLRNRLLTMASQCVSMKNLNKQMQKTQSSQSNIITDFLTQGVHLTEEEQNCIKFYQLTCNTGAKAVRIYFDNKIPDLSTHLSNHSKTINSLHAKKVLHQHQMDILYPPAPGKSVCSTDMDITLMVCLLRNTTSVPGPSTGWDKLPKITDATVGADIARVKYYRNTYLAHLSVPQLPKSDYEPAKSELSDTIHRLTSGSLDGEVEAIVSSHVISNDALQKLKDEIKRLKEETNIPKHIRERQELINQTWEDDDRLFVKTKASEEIYYQCMQHSCVTVCGNSGAGKSAIAHHVALQLQSNHGYIVIPVNTIEEIHKYGDISQKQVFVLDDPFGQGALDVYRFSGSQTYNTTVQQLLSDSKIKIICTCRKQVVNDDRFESLQTLFAQHVIDLHVDKLKLSSNEKFAILVKHTKHTNILSQEDMEDVADHEHYSFPLMCKLFGSNTSYQEKGKSFFYNMFSIVKDELKILKTQQKNHYFGLVLCMIHDNDFDGRYLDFFSKNLEEEKRKVETLAEPCGISKNEYNGKNISDGLDQMVNVYLIKEGTRYRFIHDSLNEAVTYLFGQDYPEKMLQLCSSNFLREHIGISEDNEEGYVTIQPCHYDALSRRIILEVKKGNFHIFFRNACMQDECFLKRFIDCLRDILDLRNMMLEVNINLYIFNETFISATNKYSKDNFFLSMLDAYDIKAIHWLLACNVAPVVQYCLESLEIDSKLKLMPMAALSGNLGLFKKLLHKNKTGINDEWDAKWDQRFSTLHMAVLSENTQLVKFILEEGFIVDKKSKNKLTPLHLASAMISKIVLNIIKLLIKYQANVNAVHNDGCTPIMLAAESGQLEKIELLITHKADVNKCDNDRATPMYSAAQNGYMGIVELLLTHNADINQCWMKTGASPLYQSCLHGHIDVVKTLLENKADINICDNDGATPLHAASCNGHTQTVQYLLGYGVDVNKCDNTGNTPLHDASRNGHTLTVQHLLDKGADVNKFTNNSASPILSAAQNGHMKIVEILITHNADINQRWTETGASPLFQACLSGHIDVVKTLLENKADINICNNDGATPLHAASCNGHTQTVQYLLGYGVNVNKCDNTGDTPFHDASRNGHTETVQLLLEHGADVNGCNFDGNTPLNSSSLNGHTKTVQFLLDHQADVNRDDCCGYTPLTNASRKGHTEIARLLLENHADVNRCNKCGYTPLYAASEDGDTDTVRLLLQHQADVNRRNVYGCTPLNVASENGHTETVELVLEHHADANIGNNNGYTSLHNTSRTGHIQIAELLLKHHADVNRDNRYGYTPLYIASQHGHMEYVQLLLAHHADVNRDDTFGYTALHCASRNGHTGIARVLLEHQTDVNANTNYGCTPLNIATKHRQAETVRLLLEYHADVNKYDTRECTPLHSASEIGDNEIALLLLAHHSDVNKCDNYGFTPLHYASKYGHKNTIQLLLEHHADVNKSSNDGDTAIDIASHNGHEEVADMLRHS